MKRAATVARYVLAIGFIVFGANAFLNFMSPPEVGEQGGQFMGLLFESGYFNAIAILKIAAGVLLLLGRFVPLGLTLLAPILVNILLFHVAFDPKGIGMGLVFTVLWLLVFSRHTSAFRPLWTDSRN